MAPSTTLDLRRRDDRRLAHRARLAAPTVTVTVGTKLVDAIGSDLSVGGMRLLARGAAVVGKEVSLVFFLDGELVCAQGVVCWCVPTRHDLFSFGVRFTAMEDDGPSLVTSYCRASTS